MAIFPHPTQRLFPPLLKSHTGPSIVSTQHMLLCDIQGLMQPGLNVSGFEPDPHRAGSEVQRVYA